MILLIPHPAYADALLKEGPCGSRPPRAFRQWHEDYSDPNGGTWGDEWLPCTDDYEREAPPHGALVLKWQGTILDSGCVRAARAVPMRLPDKWDDKTLNEYLPYFRHLGEIITEPSP